MKIFSNLDTFSDSNIVLTIGMFDGVHLGHAKLLNHVINQAKILGAKSALVSFWPHPRLVLDKAPDGLEFITTPEEKARIISKYGIDYIFLLPFSQELANYTAEEFIRDTLMNKIGMTHLVVGYNHRFGKDRVADYNTYLDISQRLGFGLSRVEAVYNNDKAISSTSIRHLLHEGKIEEAKLMLGYDFSILGTVYGGQKLGRTLGYPTANITPNESYKLIPSIGVYACIIKVMGKRYGGMLNIGVRPTVTELKELTIEVHILNFNQDIYSEEIEVFFIKKIRDEQKFDGIQSLINQLEADEVVIKKVLQPLGF